jgi:hypothetical protein
LVKIPPEVAIRATIRPGSVYYFPHESFSTPEPHYFVVININPVIDEVILLICASSKLATVKSQWRNCPDEAFVIISPHQYSGFKLMSILNCNYVIEQTIDQLIKRLSNGRLKLKPEMSIELVEQLRQGVMVSPTITGRSKSLLGA